MNRLRTFRSVLALLAVILLTPILFPLGIACGQGGVDSIQDETETEYSGFLAFPQFEKTDGDGNTPATANKFIAPFLAGDIDEDRIPIGDGSGGLEDSNFKIVSGVMLPDAPFVGTAYYAEGSNGHVSVGIGVTGAGWVETRDGSDVGVRMEGWELYTLNPTDDGVYFRANEFGFYDSAGNRMWFRASGEHGQDTELDLTTFWEHSSSTGIVRADLSGDVYSLFSGPLAMVDLPQHDTNAVVWGANDSSSTNIDLQVERGLGIDGDGIGINTSGVTSGMILDGTIANADLGTDSVTSSKINDGTIGAADMANNSVASAEIVDGTIVRADVQTEINLSMAYRTASGNTTATSADHFIRFTSSGTQTLTFSGLVEGDRICAKKSGSGNVVIDPPNNLEGSSSNQIMSTAGQCFCVVSDGTDLWVYSAYP